MIKVKIGRNDPCPCGSGKKFKKCCFSKPYEPSPELLADFELGQQRIQEAENEDRKAGRILPALKFSPMLAAALAVGGTLICRNTKTP